jgi:hypothetical protein
MRKVRITGYVVYDEDEIPQGCSGEYIANKIADLLFQEDFPREWEFHTESDEEIEWDEEATE